MTGSDRTSGGQWTASDAASPQTEGPACVCWPDREGTGEQWVREVRDAEPTTVRALRRRMRTWVEAVELDEELAEAVVLIVDEAVTNAVEHACSDRDCRVELVAGPRACGGGVAVVVADDGVWRENQDPGYRGRGVALMGRLSDRSSIETSEGGTTVRLCWASPRPLGS